MVVTFIPNTEKGGHFRNFQIVGEGSTFDENNGIFIQGFFERGKLNVQDVGTVTKYLGDAVSIRQGSYRNGMEDGKIYEYVFAKSEWQTFIDGKVSVSTEKYTQLFNNGIYVSTSATETKQIIGKFTINAKGYIVGFEFSEL